MVSEVPNEHGGVKQLARAVSEVIERRRRQRPRTGSKPNNDELNDFAVVHVTYEPRRTRNRLSDANGQPRLYDGCVQRVRRRRKQIKRP
ncbi:hypothetical protein EVAR_36887_1 [Eumeta japonica]|uniref:Uncharacterized protein n=1 Tax=Eumeta variegata TaxID=151549 RepID=A0A4C1WVC8_EUMVA|nr:hypothetical protein EVAR_36887_1 [Eumeta japonica]